MSKIVFYKQVREDGGVRTGIEVNDTTSFESYEGSAEESDPALVWFADVRCRGKSLPADAEKARSWLLANAEIIRQGLDSLAADLRAGIDVESYPLQRALPGAPKGVEIRLVCSAVRRPAALQIGKELVRISASWEDTIRRLPVARAIAS
ncbi:MAG: hypothetical protein FJ271_23780 [Planctomycetes bacterium]|nr:hypothetical protein [Planctomycetota bacterium]